MLTKHFFAYREWKHGRPTGIQIEVIVAQNVSRQEARRIADEEIAALREGHQTESHRDLRQSIQRAERQIERFPDYRFVGVN